MIMSHFWTLCAIISAVCAAIFQRGGETGEALISGAAAAVSVGISITGPLSLWSGIGKLMDQIGLTGKLAAILAPFLKKIYPSSKSDSPLAAALSSNVCANLLGLGNAATPMGVKAVKRLRKAENPDYATDEMCRLVVMNTASIQLLPTTVAAIRAASGCETPFDILPCVWISSILSVTAGLSAAYVLKRVWKDA